MKTGHGATVRLCALLVRSCDEDEDVQHIHVSAETLRELALAAKREQIALIKSVRRLIDERAFLLSLVPGPAPDPEQLAKWREHYEKVKP